MENRCCILKTPDLVIIHMLLTYYLKSYLFSLNIFQILGLMISITNRQRGGRITSPIVEVQISRQLR